jgi:hypothetical protein
MELHKAVKILMRLSLKECAETLSDEIYEK